MGEGTTAKPPLYKTAVFANSEARVFPILEEDREITLKRSIASKVSESFSEVLSNLRLWNFPSKKGSSKTAENL